MQTTTGAMHDELKRSSVVGHVPGKTARCLFSFANSRAIAASPIDSSTKSRAAPSSPPRSCARSNSRRTSSAHVGNAVSRPQRGGAAR